MGCKARAGSTPVKGTKVGGTVLNTAPCSSEWLMHTNLLNAEVVEW